MEAKKKKFKYVSYHCIRHMQIINSDEEYTHFLIKKEKKTPIIKKHA